MRIGSCFKFLLSLSFVPALTFGQVVLQDHGETGKLLTKFDAQPKGLVLDKEGIYPVSLEPTDTLYLDIERNLCYYSFSDSLESLWFKIYALDNAPLIFNIFAMGNGGRYNYFMYESPVDFTVEDIKMKNIYPIRANLYKGQTDGGTGILSGLQINYNDTSSAVRKQILYGSAYHHAVQLKAGNVYLLNVYHMEGKDCGPKITLKTTNGSPQHLYGYYDACYKGRLNYVKVSKQIRLRNKDEKNAPLRPESVVIDDSKPKVGVYQAWDSLKKSMIAADIKWNMHKKGAPRVIRGEGDITLSPDCIYNVQLTCIGYKSKTVSFSTDKSPEAFTRMVFLEPVKEGEEFSIEEIYFYPNTYALRPGAGKVVDKLLTYLQSNPEIRIEIQGFTNGNNRIRSNPDLITEGSYDGSAKGLSKRRAETIKNYLVKRGIDESRLNTHGFGGSRMIYPKPRNQDEANKNIRVGVLLLPSSPQEFSRKNK